MPFIVDPRLSLSWQRHSGATETAGTGPSFDHTVGYTEEGASRGHYVYMDSPGYMLGETATLLAPPQIYPSGSYCLRFWFHMFGDDVNSLRVYVREIEGGSTQTPGDWGQPLLLRVGNQGDAWIEGGLEFTSNGRTPQQLVFEALAGYSEKADIALDDIRLTQGHCPPLLLRDEALQENICGEVRLQTGTWGEDKQWFLEGAVSCAGRGYSLSMMQNRWVPCCVPRFGQYSVVLRDSFGDGWGGSRLTFRFFGEEVTFGEDFDGAERKYTLNIGFLQIQKVEGSEDAIAIQVQVAAAQQYVWCGAALAAAPPATAAILKKYGVRSQHATSRAGEVLRMEISNRGAPRRIVTPNTTYNVYCYAESALSSLVPERDSAPPPVQMTDAQVAASRVAVTTDNIPPTVQLLGTRPGLNDVEIRFTVRAFFLTRHRSRPSPATQTPSCICCMLFLLLLLFVGCKVDEAATVWCVAVEETASNAAGGEAPSVEAVKKGPKAQVLGEQANTQQSLLLKNLSPDSVYKAFCYAEDAALPKGNGVPPEVARRLTLSFRTLSKVPELTIASYQAFQRGFRITVKTDAPAKVWCGAAMVGSAYPTKEDVRRVGATAVVEGAPLQAELEIRGVPPNTRYTIYCFAASRGGSEETSEADMWENALEVTSFGKFCDVPVEPGDVTVGDASPFDPITKDEELLVRGFMSRQRQLSIEGIYRITLYVDKERIVNYLDNGGPLPPRYARVRVGLCSNREGAYVQYKVGPLDAGAATAGAAATAAAANAMTIEQLGPAVPTDCGGYNPQGVFGRRLVADSEEQELSDVLQESFGAPFGGQRCQYSAKHKLNSEGAEGGDAQTGSEVQNQKPVEGRLNCLEFGPTFYEEDDELAQHPGEGGALKRVWLGLRTPDGQRVPFFFIATPIASQKNQNLPGAQEAAAAFSSGEEVFQLDRVEGVWYDGQEFNSLSAFLEAYRSGGLQKVTPELLAERRRERAEQEAKERQRRRRLAPAWLAPNPKGRGGLEHRAAPEHIEPQGRRYTLELSPSGASYTVEYAGWRFTINFDRDTSLRLWDVRFGGQRFVFEMGLMEALAHYSVAERNWYFIDSWYGGLGAAARKLHPGIECAKTGQVLFNDGSVCIFEQDLARPLRAHWKGGVLRDGAPHMALVLRQMITVSNYDYITDYIFHVSGFLEGTVSFTGELYAGVEVPWYSARQREHGTQVSGSMRMGALHGHLAVWKLDFDLTPDYKQNSIVFSEIVRDPQRPGAIKLNQWMGATEEDGFVAFNSTRPIHYTIVNEEHNVYGNLGGMTVLPYPTFSVRGAAQRRRDNGCRRLFFPRRLLRLCVFLRLVPPQIPNPDFELYAGPCAWAKYRVATTVRHDYEVEATLPRDNKHALRPAVSLDRYLSVSRLRGLLSRGSALEARVACDDWLSVWLRVLFAEQGVHSAKRLGHVGEQRRVAHPGGGGHASHAGPGKHAGLVD